MDAIKFTFAFLAIVVPFVLAALKDKRMWIWVAFWIGPIICGFGVTEGISYFRLSGIAEFLIISIAAASMWAWYKIISNQSAKKTISRVFWEFKDAHPLYAIACIAGMITFWAYLCLHLVFRW